MAPRKKAAAVPAEKKVTTSAPAVAVEKKEVPAETKAVKEVKKEEVKKEEVKKEEVKKEEVRKAEPKKTVRKAPAKKEAKTGVVVQFAGKEFSGEELVEAAKKAYAASGQDVSAIETLTVYVKPEESAAYYVVNGFGSDDYKIEL